MSSLALVSFYNRRGTATKSWGPNVLTGTPLRAYPPPPFGASVSSLALVSFSNQYRTATKSWGPSVLTGTPPCLYPLRGTTRRLTHRSVSDSDTICNNPDPPNIYCLFWVFPFGLPLKAFRC